MENVNKRKIIDNLFEGDEQSPEEVLRLYNVAVADDYLKRHPEAFQNFGKAELALVDDRSEVATPVDNFDNLGGIQADKVGEDESAVADTADADLETDIAKTLDVVEAPTPSFGTPTLRQKRMALVTATMANTAPKPVAGLSSASEELPPAIKPNVATAEPVRIAVEPEIKTAEALADRGLQEALPPTPEALEPLEDIVEFGAEGEKLNDKPVMAKDFKEEDLLPDNAERAIEALEPAVEASAGGIAASPDGNAERAADLLGQAPPQRGPVASPATNAINQEPEGVIAKPVIKFADNNQDKSVLTEAATEHVADGTAQDGKPNIDTMLPDGLADKTIPKVDKAELPNISDGKVLHNGDGLVAELAGKAAEPPKAAVVDNLRPADIVEPHPVDTQGQTAEISPADGMQDESLVLAHLIEDSVPLEEKEEDGQVNAKLDAPELTPDQAVALPEVQEAVPAQAEATPAEVKSAEEAVTTPQAEKVIPVETPVPPIATAETAPASEQLGSTDAGFWEANAKKVGNGAEKLKRPGLFGRLFGSKDNQHPANRFGQGPMTAEQVHALHPSNPEETEKVA